MNPVFLRLLKAALVAALLGAALIFFSGQAKADENDGECDANDPNDEADCLVVQNVCSRLEPYSYWWYAFYCDQEQGMAMTSEDRTIGLMPDRISLVLARTYADGSVRVFYREIPRRVR